MSFPSLKIHQAYVDLTDVALIESNVKTSVLICFLSFDILCFLECVESVQPFSVQKFIWKFTYFKGFLLYNTAEHNSASYTETEV